MEPKKIFIKRLQLICPEISDEDLKAFESGLMVQNFKNKELVFEYSKPQSNILFIITGMVRSFYINENGTEISAYFIREYDFVSDYPAFLTDSKSNYFFQALENTSVVIIPKKLILKAYETSPKFEKFGRLIAEEAVKFLQARVDSFIFKSATDRYLDFIKTEKELINRLSLQHIATYLGIERQSLTRIRKNLRIKNDTNVSDF
jgi:CRP/FNR family transcriptional regulator, anaerobic regulatory protein